MNMERNYQFSYRAGGGGEKIGRLDTRRHLKKKQNKVLIRQPVGGGDI